MGLCFTPSPGSLSIPSSIYTCSTNLSLALSATSQASHPSGDHWSVDSETLFRLTESGFPGAHASSTASLCPRILPELHQHGNYQKLSGGLGITEGDYNTGKRLKLTYTYTHIHTLNPDSVLLPGSRACPLCRRHPLALSLLFCWPWCPALGFLTTDSKLFLALKEEQKFPKGKYNLWRCYLAHNKDSWLIFFKQSYLFLFFWISSFQ